MDSKIIISIVLSIVIIFLNSCTTQENGNQISHREFLQTHPFSIGQTNFTIQDSNRNRPIKTEVWYPTRDTSKFNIVTKYPFLLPPTSKDAEIIKGTYPLILLSHGTGGNGISLMWLACELASNGYIVAAVDHYGNTYDNKIPENFVKAWDRPQDISFLLSHLLEESDFKTKIDKSKIGMLGFSLGGYTSIALAGGEIDYQLLSAFTKTKEGKNESKLPEMGDVSKLITPQIIERGNRLKNLKDTRISAFVALAPAIGQGFKNKSQLKKIDKPILIVGAENDIRTPINTNAKHYHNLIENAEYIELKGKIGHYIFLNEATSALVNEGPIYFKDDQTVSRNAIHAKVSTIVVDFFSKQLEI